MEDTKKEFWELWGEVNPKNAEIKIWEWIEQKLRETELIASIDALECYENYQNSFTSSMTYDDWINDWENELKELKKKGK